MSDGIGEEADAVLSDVEADEPSPVVLKHTSSEEVSSERFKELLAELDREKQAREAAEISKSELQTQFNRLKALTHEAIRKRDDAAKQRDEALREKESSSRELEEVRGSRDELSRQNDEISKELDVVVKERDDLRADIEHSTHMLTSGMDKISGKINNLKNFPGGGLPKSQKYTGLASIAYGVIKRTNDIVEELIRHSDATTRSRNEVREQMEQRNYEIAIEVSQLEATISGLREEVEKKNSLVEQLEKNVTEKDDKISELEREMLEKANAADSDLLELRQMVDGYEEKLRTIESKNELKRPLLVDQLSLVSKIHNRLYEIIRIIDGDDSEKSELSETLFMAQETDMEENIRASLAGMESIYELTRITNEKMRGLVDTRRLELKSLNDTVGQLMKEKEHIGMLLRSAMSKRMISEQSSNTSDLLQAAQNGLRNVGVDFKFRKVSEDLTDEALGEKYDGQGSEEDEICTLAGALEDIVKASQLEILGLQHSVEELRAESNFLKKNLEAQAKELTHRMRQIEELEEKEKLASESVEGLMTDVAAAEEEIKRWKAAAEQEAAAGRAVEQEYMSKLLSLRKELEEAKQATNDSEGKLKLKEETASAAMAARDAAEKSLRLADSRAHRLRERVEELSHQLEEFESREGSRGRSRPRYECWPWQWLGLNFVGGRESQMQLDSNEMELSEPLI